MVNSDGYMIAKAGNDYGILNCLNPCGWPSYEEAEGLDIPTLGLQWAPEVDR